MIKMNRKDFHALIDGIATDLFENYKKDIEFQIKEWKNIDNRPAVINEPPVEKEPAVIDPKSSLQVVDENMPIEDSDWIPGNLQELGRAMKQMSQMVPDSQIEWFYSKSKRLVDKAIDQEDETRMQPRLNDMQPEMDH